MPESLPPIQLCESDATLLLQTIHKAVVDGQFIRGRENTISDLIHEVSRARILPAEEPQGRFATLGSRVRYEDCLTGEEVACCLVAPDQASGSRGHVSILSPLGAALIGHSEEEVITYEALNGPEQIRILAISPAAEA